MCGVAGSFNPSGDLDRSLCVEMHKRLHHRGPDETYSLNERTLAAKLGRLGMIGLRNGWQPLDDSSGRYVAFTNGEIFNARTLFEELGVQPCNGNEVDVAIVPEIVAREGIAGLARIDGQFAATIYDRHENVLYLARDRFGICPLYYAQIGDVLHFCSELRALVQAVPNDWHLDYTAVDQFLALGNVVAPRTLVEDVLAVAPGCAVRFANGPPTTIRYWRYGAFSEGGNSPSAENLRAGMQRAISARLHSDVSIGAYLSGGFDSTAILMDASAMSRRPIQSFSVAFDDPTLDEAPFQRQVARIAGSLHNEIRCTRADVANRFESMVRHCCFPQRETYNVAALMLSESVQWAGIKGVLSGEGADELFFGYDSYAFDSARRKPREESDENALTWGRADFSWEVETRRVEKRRRNFLSDHGRDAVVGREFWRQRLIPYRDDELRGLSHMQLRSIADVYVQLAGHLLGDHGDSMVMAHSIEGRYPFLGNDVVDLALMVPDAEKVADFEGKSCMRKAYLRTVPDIVLNRGKHGFTAYDLQSVVDQKCWSEWRDMVHSVEALNPDCMDGDPGQYREEKWDFRLGAISLAMIADELSLRC